jgi:hypothetical protein
MRKLIYVPVIHTAVELGSLSEKAAETFRRRHGEAKWREHQTAIGEIWGGIERRLVDLRLELSKTKIYQDGLPICGKEEEIIRDLAANGSPNHRIVSRLLDGGARLVGTESPALLLAELRALTRCLEAPEAPGGREADEERERADLLVARDRFVAARIDETLGEGEVGILFMGILHEVERHLPADVSVEFLIHRLPFRRDVDAGLIGPARQPPRPMSDRGGERT